MPKFLIAPLLFACLLVSVGCSKPPPPEDSASLLQGTWHFIEDDERGDELAVFDKGFFVIQKIKIDGDVRTFEFGTGNKCSIQVDPSKSPAEIDFVYTAGQNLGKIRRGIFVLDEDKLDICMADFDDPTRPVAFVADEKATLMHLVRKK